MKKSAYVTFNKFLWCPSPLLSKLVGTEDLLIKLCLTKKKFIMVKEFCNGRKGHYVYIKFELHVSKEKKSMRLISWLQAGQENLFPSFNKTQYISTILL